MKSKDIPIFVTGAERSGSSIIARIFSICGAWTGGCDNMMRNKQLKKLVDDYYTVIEKDVKGQNPLPDTQKLFIPTEWRDGVERIKNNEYKVWLYKDSRLCQTWPIWHHAFPEARWIIVRRRTGDIITSCMKTYFMNEYDDEEGWKAWVKYHEQRFVEMIDAGVNCKVIWPERMVQGDYRQIYEMLEWCGLRWRSEIVKQIDPLFEKSRIQI